TNGIEGLKKPGVNRASFPSYLNVFCGRLAATTTTSRAGRDGGSLELFEVLEHTDHRVARGRMRLVRDRAAERDAKLGAELRLDQPVGAEGFLRIVVVEVGFTARCCDPNGGESGGTATRLRRSEILDRSAEALTNQRHGRKSDEAVVVVIRPT
ncbi:MAG TPA: hypothetical protein VK427_11200, partial [Kofleriaceae bacterium]|nr:hypothetical protein [Kofleriaceae bacterium]